VQTIRSNRANFEFVMGVQNGSPLRVKFENHRASLSDEAAKLLIGCRTDDFYTVVYDKPPSKGDSILFTRNGGVGDILLTTPLIRELHKLGAEIDYVTDYPDILLGNPNIRKVYKTGQDLPDGSSYQFIVDVNQYTENADLHGNKDHRAIVFGKAIDLTLDKSQIKLDYYITKKEAQAGKKTVDAVKKQTGCDKVIVFVWDAHCPQRIWSDNRRYNTIKALSEKNYATIVLCRDLVEIPSDIKGVINLSTKADLRKCGSLISACDCVLTPDTGLMHLAAALDVPTVAYMGQFPPEERCTHDKLIVLNEPSTCSIFPCHQYRCMNRGTENIPRCIDLAIHKVINAVDKIIECNIQN